MPQNVPGCLMITGCKMYIYKVHWELLLVVFFTSQTSHQTHNRWHSTDGPMSRLNPSCSGCRSCCWRCAAWPWPRPPCPPPASTARSASTRCTASAGSWRTAPMTLRWHSTLDLDHSPSPLSPLFPCQEFLKANYCPTLPDQHAQDSCVRDLANNYVAMLQVCCIALMKTWPGYDVCRWLWTTSSWTALTTSAWPGAFATPSMLSSWSTRSPDREIHSDKQCVPQYWTHFVFCQIDSQKYLNRDRKWFSC